MTQARPPTPDRTAVRATAWALIALGAWLRIARYLDARSLWVDEARLAVNLVERSFAGLAGPLEWQQSAPIGFLWLSKLATVVGGEGELALRALPLVAGLASLPLFRVLVRRVLAPWEGLLALALFALAEPLVHYASELKPYGVDVAACVALLAAGAVWLEAPLRGARLVALAALGSIALALSLPAVFACAGVVAALGLERWRSRGRRDVVRVVALGLGWMLLFLALWFFFVRPKGADWVQRHWAVGFLPLLPGSAAELGWYPRMLGAYFADPVGLAFPRLALAAGALGAVGIVLRAPLRAVLLLAPLGALVLASGLRQYPIVTSPPSEYPLIGRLILFTVPIGLALAAAGIGLCWRRGGWLGRGVAAVGGLALLATSTATALAKLAEPPRLQEMREVARFVAAHAEPGDRFWIYEEAEPAFRHYWRRAGAEPLPELEILPRHYANRSFERHAARLAERAAGFERGRLWIVYAHHRFWPSRDEERVLRGLLERHARRTLSITRPGASAHRYEAGERPPVEADS